MNEKRKIKIAEWIWNLPLRLGFSRDSFFQLITLKIGDKIVFKTKCQ